MFFTAPVFLSLVLFALILYSFRNPNNAYFLLLKILHFIYLLYTTVVSPPWNFTFKRNRDYELLTPSKVREDLNRLDKIPKHLAVIYWGKAKDSEISEQHLSEVAQLCCWATCARVKVLSVYEAQGDLRLIASHLQSHIQIATRHFFARDKAVPTTRVTALAGISSVQPNNIDIDEAFVPDLQVNLVSRADGRRRIVEITKSLASDVIKGKIKSDVVDVDEVDRRLSIPNFPEPQLLITFAPKIDLDGFPPWHIRLTEIYHVPGNTRFDYSIFIGGLFKYSKCDQRYGR